MIQNCEGKLLYFEVLAKQRSYRQECVIQFLHADARIACLSYTLTHAFHSRLSQWRGLNKVKAYLNFSGK